MTFKVSDLLNGDKRALAKAITLVESKKSSHQEQARELIEQILPHTGKANRVAISGVPGVGKSTFIDHFLNYFLQNQKTSVAVLTVDPSSPKHGGSILGDKTRMEHLIQNDAAFIRPTPTSGSLGGVAKNTKEAILLCEAAGYEWVFIETVGVGQSEHLVSQMVDCFCLLMLPNAGDELQGIKKGILELADLILINKADAKNRGPAQQALTQYKQALAITSQSQNRQIYLCSSTEQYNFDSIQKYFLNYFSDSQKLGTIKKKREQQNVQWFEQLTKESILAYILNDSDQQKLYNDYLLSVRNSKSTPFAASQDLIKKLFNKET